MIIFFTVHSCEQFIIVEKPVLLLQSQRVKYLYSLNTHRYMNYMFTKHRMID